MAKILGLDLGTNSIGWALMDTDNNTMHCGAYILPEISDASKRHQQRQLRRHKNRLAQRLMATRLVKPFYLAAFIDKIKKVFPVFVHCLLALLFASSLLMALTHQKDFQFWFNLSITILLGWIAVKK